MTLPRPPAAGVRRRYGEVPERVRAWVEARLGSPVVTTLEQSGGMSPGCATRLVCADGTRAFVKAVGPELNPDTPTLFRREAHALSLLGDHPLWASLLAVLDEPDGWVALLLEDVPGRRPDIGDDADMSLLLRATDALAAAVQDRVPALPEARAGADLLDTRAAVRRWVDGVAEARQLPEGALPGWLADRLDELPQRCDALLAAVEGRQLVHWDIRDDNVLVRDDGSVVFVDWGAASWGPPWADPLLARLERVTDPWFDASLRGSPALEELGDEAVTTFLLAFGTFLAHRSHVAVDVNLPTMNDFRRAMSARCLEGARRRLGVG